MFYAATYYHLQAPFREKVKINFSPGLCIESDVVVLPFDSAVIVGEHLGLVLVSGDGELSTPLSASTHFFPFVRALCLFGVTWYGL